MRNKLSIRLLVVLTFYMWCLYSADAQSFECNSNLYQVVNGNELKVLDPSSGIYESIGTSSIKYNGAGFNYEDGFIYGISSGSSLIRVGNSGEASIVGSISGFSALSYSGDFDLSGNWYSFKKKNSTWIMNKVDVSASTLVAEESTLTLLSGKGTPTNTADITFNAVTGKFYGMTSGLLIEYDIDAKTVQVIGDYSSVAESEGYGAAWSDQSGKSYFFNNNTGNIYRAEFGEEGSVLSFAFVATSEPNGSNDGMGCSLAEAPTFPEICDNGIDDDGDGLTDCEDPDCYGKEACGVSSTIFSSTFACEQSIATYHVFYTNNSTITNTLTLTETLPSGFVFLQDTLEFDAGGSSDLSVFPQEGDTGTVMWGTITLEGKETVRISYDVSISNEVNYGNNNNSIIASLGNANTSLFPSSLSTTIAVGTCPEPEVYTCEPAFYQVYKKRGKNQPNMYGRLNPLTGDYDPIAVASDYANGLGYDINTGLVYGASGRRFIQLDQEGLVIDQDISFNKNVYRGDVNENSEWYGVDGSDIVKIDISGAPYIAATYVGQGLPGWDIAFNKDGHFYSIHNQSLYQFNTETNTKSVIANLSGIDLPSSGGYGAQWTGSDGYLYASHNKTGKILRINVETGESRTVSYSIDGLSKNDGFSCPTEIPVVFEFDYSDNSRLPLSRVLAYRQDLSNDGIPDFSMLWFGNTVNFDTSNPSNEDANGDSDDGFSLDTEIVDGALSTAIGFNSNFEGQAYCLIGIDWNDDGNFDEVTLETPFLSTATTMMQTIATPDSFNGGNINVRIIITEEPIDESNISGDIIGMGEVEDYRFLITEPCTGPNCEVSTGNNGGLESNGSLARAIAKRSYNRQKNNSKLHLKSNQMDLQSLKRARTSQKGLERFFPETGMRGNEVSTVSSPEDLISLTNAQDVFAADYYANDRRVAAGLVLKTEGDVYNHSKNVCDRLNGKSIQDVYLANIDGARVIIAEIQKDGITEFSGWFAAKNTQSNYEIHSYWNVDTYPEGDYLNFQVWSSSTTQVVYLLKNVLSQLKSEKETTAADLQPLPSIIVKSGAYEEGQLTLSILNQNATSSANVDINFRRSENSSFENNSFPISLNGENEQELVIETGYLFDAGISISVDNIEGFDALYLADGAWGTDYDVDQSSIEQFEIVKEQRTKETDIYFVERGFSLEGSSSDVINVFRNLKAGNAALDISSYTTLSFEIQNSHPIEVSLVPESLTNWEDRLTSTIPAHEISEMVSLRIEDFVNRNDYEDLKIKTIVFSYQNQSGTLENIQINAQSTAFGDAQLTLATEDELDLNTRVYPNPATDYINASFYLENLDKYTISLINLNGKVVRKIEGQASGEVTVELQRSTLNNGIYLLQLATPTKKTSRKVIFK